MLVAIDTSTLTMSISVLDGQKVVHETTVGPPTRLSQALPQAIVDLIKIEDISAFVVGIGPGSFTGLRISLACVKGIAYARKVPVAGVSSLQAVEAEGPSGAELFSTAVVKKGELYVRREGQETVMTVDAFAALMKERPSAIALGPGMVDYASKLQEAGIAAERLLTTIKFPRAALLAQFAKMPETYDQQTVFAMEPHYIRSSGAEDNPKFPPLVGVPATARLK